MIVPGTFNSLVLGGSFVRHVRMPRQSDGISSRGAGEEDASRRADLRRLTRRQKTRVRLPLRRGRAPFIAPQNLQQQFLARPEALSHTSFFAFSDPEMAEENPEDSVDITISNVVSHFSVRCHLNLRTIATNGSNVVYQREQSIILMKLRTPQVTASIWSSGKIVCTGASSEEQAKSASRRVARVLQRMGFRVKFSSYRVVNVLGTCRMPFGIKIGEFSTEHRRVASYEPELHPGATYRMKELKAVLKIFQTGSITITAPSVHNVQMAVEHIYPLVYEFRKPKPHGYTDNHHCREDADIADLDDSLKPYDKLDKLLVDKAGSSSSDSE